MADPITIPREQLRAAYDALGLDSERWPETKKVTLEGGRVTVVRARLDESGRTIALRDFFGVANEVATETITIAIEEDPA